jgi:hypothetical protein
MAEAAILFSRATKAAATAPMWLARARQARRIAIMLSAVDAEIVEVFALECEAEAKRLIDRQEPAIAA